VKVVEYPFYNPLKDDDGQEIWCRKVCPDLPLNGVIIGYRKTRGRWCNL